MTSRDGSPQRLPPEVEFQARREEFLKRFHQLDERGEVNPGNANVISTPPIYFREGEEVFELSFSRRRYKNQSRAVQCERELEIAALKSDTRSIYGTVYDGKSERHSAAQVNCVLPYYPSADFTVVKEDPNGNLSGLNARHIESIGELDELINIINFMNDSISRGNSSESPITDIPGAVRDLVARIRKSERMKFEYKLPEFYDVLGRVRDKTAEVANIYNGSDLASVKTILNKYNVSYVIVGDFEREKYPDLNEKKFEVLGSRVFSSGNLSVYRVKSE